MKITYSKTVNIFDYSDVWEHIEVDYFGHIDELKGNNSQTEMNTANAQRAQEMQMMQQQLAAQQNVLGVGAGGNALSGGVLGTLQAIQNAGGMLPAQEAAMTSQVQNLTGAGLQNSMGAINQNLVARGLTGGQGGAGGGGVGAGYGQMMAMLGQAQQQGLSNIQLAKGQGLMNALGGEMNIAGILGGNVSNFNQGAGTALNAGVTAANNADQAQTSWLGPMLGGLTGLAGKATYSGAGGFGFGCWVAAECFGGMEVPKVQFIRIRLWHNAQNSFKFKAILTAYAIFGRSVAKIVKKFGWMKRMFTSIFDKFVLGEMDKMLDEAVHG